MLAPTTVTVNRVNDAATISGDTSALLNEDLDPDNDGILRVTGMLSSIDPDAGDTGFQAAMLAGSYGSLTIDTAGNWGYDAANAQSAVQQLDVGESIIDSFVVASSDGTTQTLTLTIDGSEDVPVIAGTTQGNVAIDGAHTASGNLTISDADGNDNPIQFVDAGPSAGDNGLGNFSISGGTWTFDLNAAHGAVQALGVGQSLTDTFTFLASDGSSQQVSVLISGPATVPPVIDPTGPIPIDPAPPYGLPEPPFEVPVDQDPDPQDEPQGQDQAEDPTSQGSDAGPLAGLPPDSPRPLSPDLVLLSVLGERDSAQARSPAATLSDEESRDYLLEMHALWESQLQEIPEQVTQVHSDAFWNDLQQMINDFNRDADKVENTEKFGAEAAAGISLSLTAGFVSWALRAGSMAASFLAAMPTWRNFDPMPVLAAEDERKVKPGSEDSATNEKTEREDDDRKVDAMFER